MTNEIMIPRSGSACPARMWPFKSHHFIEEES